jgi:hypothetical protein
MHNLVNERKEWGKLRGMDGLLPDQKARAGDATTPLVDKYLGTCERARALKIETVQYIYFDNNAKPHVADKARLEALNDEIATLESCKAALGAVLEDIEAMGSPFLSELATTRRGLLDSIARLERTKAAALAATIRRRSYRYESEALEDPTYQKEAAVYDHQIAVSKARLEDVTARIGMLNALITRGAAI